MKITFTQYDLACMMGLVYLPDYPFGEGTHYMHAFGFHGVVLMERSKHYDDEDDNVKTRVGARVMEMVGKAAAKMFKGDNNGT